ncbi:hypothetical protein GCM10010967_57650 [Dyadobacter beijingensis]|uniref:ATP-binding protein n=2 Tax=Dyadobacter beijingensis TaxID=365489 RepID=A0ABQ2IJB3_9BACT|nr:hypothetical protein GCM10010967_57650 [Dyadobacter beijingensis]
MIDALNEGPGKDLWKDSLAGFIQDVKRYPFVGVIMTVRSTYFNAILPTNLQNDETITYRDHQGFKGNEYAALRLFCEHYGLQMPTFPILTPEFANPLFLQLLCQGVKISRNRTFPHGFQGITKVFNYYIDAVFERLVGKRDEYENRRHIVRDAIFTVAKACFSDDNSRILSFEDADRLFEKTFPRFQHLLNDLIHENVFIQTTQNTYDLNPGFEALSFSYERFGDIFIAEELLAGYVSTADVSQAFQKDGKLGRLLKGYLWPNRGVLDAMAIRLPERYGLELMEICDWVYAEEEDSEYSDVGEWLSRSFWDSLKWRHPESIDNAKITTWLNSDQCMLNEHEYTLKLVELATVQQHPFNSDRLFRYLNQFSMAERDAFWQEHMLRYSRYDDDRNALPIRRLMDWAWQKGISSSVDMETARLAAQTLAWLLSSTYRQLRDQVTKAMVNLLEEQPDVLIEVMTAFKDTDDVYISERLYSVAYGCVLRTANGSSIAKIAKYVYNRTFIGKNPPIHVLLRDYARNILEYADYKGLADYADMARVRPPYNSDFPKRLPSESEIKQFENSFEGTGQSLEKEKNRIYGQIHFSTTTWDFGRYVVKSALRHFAPTSFKFESTYRDFKKSLKGKRKSFISVLESSARLHSVIEERRAQGVKSLFGKSTDDWLREEEEHLQVCLDRMNGPFDQIEMMQIRDEFLPFLKAKYASQSGQRDAIDDGPIKRWIVQRSFQLGYDIEKHYDYDSRTERLNEFPDYYGSKIERIGKKYQWIAFHEIVARLCDNYHFIEDRWSSSAKYGLYQGPWQLLIRDVDPVFTTKTKREENDSDLGEATDFSKKDWRFDADYRYWNQPVSQWVRNKQDLPAPEKMILRKDDYGHEWVYLRMNKTWQEPKGVGSDRHISRKEIWYGINSYLVPKRDRKKIVAWLEGKNFFGRWMPEPDEMSLNLFNRENY